MNLFRILLCHEGCIWGFVTQMFGGIHVGMSCCGLPEVVGYHYSKTGGSSHNYESTGVQGTVKPPTALDPTPYLEGCHNYGPFLAPYYSTAPNI